MNVVNIDNTIITQKGVKYNKKLTASVRKEKKMSEMTDLQFEAIIKAVIQIVKDNDDKNEMIEKIEALVNKN